MANREPQLGSAAQTRNRAEKRPRDEGENEENKPSQPALKKIAIIEGSGSTSKLEKYMQALQAHITEDLSCLDEPPYAVFKSLIIWSRVLRTRLPIEMLQAFFQFTKANLGCSESLPLDKNGYLYHEINLYLYILRNNLLYYVVLDEQYRKRLKEFLVHDNPIDQIYSLFRRSIMENHDELMRYLSDNFGIFLLQEEQGRAAKASSQKPCAEIKALFAACQVGKMSVIKEAYERYGFLIAYLKNGEEYSLLSIAACHHHAEIVHYLHQHIYQQSHAYYFLSLRQAFLSACVSRSEQIMSFLLDKIYRHPVHSLQNNNKRQL